MGVPFRRSRRIGFTAGGESALFPGEQAGILTGKSVKEAAHAAR
jgi:hypothetical protein